MRATSLPPLSSWLMHRTAPPTTVKLPLTQSFFTVLSCLPILHGHSFFSLLYISRLLSYLHFFLSFFLSFLPSRPKLLNLFLSPSLIGNKYGEPVVCGFARSFGQRLPNKERVEWIKPIMFTAGLGWLDSRHTSKGKPANLYMKREDRRWILQPALYPPSSPLTNLFLLQPILQLIFTTYHPSVLSFP